MTAQPKRSITEAEYLEFERASTSKHEYIAGDIVAMTGASEQHNLIASNVTAALHPQLRGRACRIYPSDMRLKVVQTGLNTYPDLTIVCGPSQFSVPTRRDTLINPTVIIEILSPSTERYDRGLKFQNYRTIPSLQEYLLIAQDAPHIERFARNEANQWVFADAVGIDATLEIPSISALLMLSDVYEQVIFPEVSDSSYLQQLPIQ
ncbi:MAG: Uma2 family endonuclease [Roseiflexaceae bacterium]|nr:Uma2 family endonuclease [Roseiflexaceae bacterium]